jgi:hypothetical protein
MARPSIYPRWAVDELGNPPPVGSKYGKPAIQVPSSGKRNLGWEEEEYPPRQYLNWLSKNTYEWVKYLDERLGKDSKIVNFSGIGVGTEYGADDVGDLHTDHNGVRINNGLFMGSPYTNNMSINAWMYDNGQWKFISDGAASLYIQRADNTGALMHEWWATDYEGTAGDDITWKEIAKIRSQNDSKLRQGLFVNRLYATKGGSAGLNSFAQLTKDSISIYGGDVASINQSPLWKSKYVGNLTDGFCETIGKYRESGIEKTLFMVNKNGYKEGGRKQHMGRWVELTSIWGGLSGEPSPTIYDSNYVHQSPFDFTAGFIDVMVIGSTLFLRFKFNSISLHTDQIINPARFEFPIIDPTDSFNDILDFSSNSIGYAVVKGSTIDTKFYELHLGNGDYYDSKYVVYSDLIDWHGGSGASDTQIRGHCTIDMRNSTGLSDSMDIFPLKNKFY